MANRLAGGLEPPGPHTTHRTGPAGSVQVSKLNHLGYRLPPDLRDGEVPLIRWDSCHSQ
jgi:hypothetical protein